MIDVIVAPRDAERSLLIVESDRCVLRSLARTMETFGFTVTTVESVADGLQQVERAGPAFAVVEMRFADGQWSRPDLGPEIASTGCPGCRPHQPRRYRDRGKGREAGRCGLPHQAGKRQRRRRGRGFARHRPDEDRVAHKAGLRERRSSRAHSTHLRAEWPQCFEGVAPPQHAPTHVAAHSGEMSPKVIVR